MTAATDVASGKSHRDENFPVASHLIAARHRPAILAFYNFVRAADDIADHPTLTPGQKLDFLDRLEGSLMGRSTAEPVAAPLRSVLAARKLPPRHALDLLAAFRRDVIQPRTQDWADLIDYCSLSAMPVGRYVLDIHGERESTWEASDQICAALQIINHLQDCGRDFRDLDRVYIPLDRLAAAGLDVTALGAEQASPALRGVIAELAARCTGLLDAGSGLPRIVEDGRLGLETAVIIALARDLALKLGRRDPLRDKVHHGKAAALRIAASSALLTAARRWFAPAPRTAVSAARKA